MVDNKRGPGWIYLLRGNNDWYRIGRTGNPKQRFISWRWSSKNNHYGLEPVALIKVSNQESAENMFHAIFANKRTDQRRNGKGRCHEWFKLNADDLSRFFKWANTIVEVLDGKVYRMNGNWSLEGIYG